MRVEKEGNVMAFMNLFYKHRSVTVAKFAAPPLQYIPFVPIDLTRFLGMD